MIKVSGINGSTRKGGNSQFLMQQAMRGAQDAAGDVRTEMYGINGKMNCPQGDVLCGQY